MAHEMLVKSGGCIPYLDIHDKIIRKIPQYKFHGLVVMDLPNKKIPKRGLKSVYVSSESKAKVLQQTLKKLPNTERVFLVSSHDLDQETTPNEFLKYVTSKSKTPFASKLQNTHIDHMYLNVELIILFP